MYYNPPLDKWCRVCSHCGETICYRTKANCKTGEKQKGCRKCQAQRILEATQKSRGKLFGDTILVCPLCHAVRPQRLPLIFEDFNFYCHNCHFRVNNKIDFDNES